MKKLTGEKKFSDYCLDRFWIYKIMRHKSFQLTKTHSLLYRPLHSQESYPILILQEFANRPNPPVPKMIYIIHNPLPVLQSYEITNHTKDIFFTQCSMFQGGIKAKFPVELQPAYF